MATPAVAAQHAAAPPIPTAPGALPLLGHLPHLVRNPLRYLETLPAHGDLVALRLGRKNIVVVCDPKLTHQVLVLDNVYDKGGPLFDAARRRIPHAVGIVPHGEHRRLRRMMQPSFHHSRMAGYGAIMTAQIDAATSAWHEGQSIDVVAEMMKITTRVVTSAMFSAAVTGDALAQMIDDSIEMLSGLMRDTALPGPLRRLAPGNRRYEQAVARLRQAMLDIIVQRRAEGTDHGDLLSALLEGSVEESGDQMSNDEIIDQLVLFVLAGVDSTAQTVSWSLYELSRHPEIEAALHDEVDRTLGSGPARHEHLAGLELTGRIITEILRLHVPSWMFTRYTTTDTELGGYRIPKGTDVVYSPYIIGLRPQTFADPDLFDPDRWLPDQASAVPREGYIPFGGGARKCIGNDFAVMEDTMMLATIASRWSLEAVPGNKIGTSRGIVQRPQGLRLRAVAR